MFSRQWLFGFGAGLVFSAGFLFVFSSKEDGAASITQEQLQAAAESLQMVVVPKAEYDRKKQEGDQQAGLLLPTVNEPQAPKVQAPDQPKSTENKQTQPPSVSAIAQPSNAQNPSLSKPSTANTSASPLSPATSSTSVRETTVKIPGGATSTEVATILAEAGILSSETKFVETMKAQKKQSRIRAGTYTFNSDISLEGLIIQLTTPPKK